MNIQDILNKATQTAYPEPDSPLHSQIIPRVVQLFAGICKPPKTILDIGCGSGFGAMALRNAGFDVTAISVLESEVTELKAKGFKAELCEMHDTIRLGEFDAIWLRHAAEHSPCPLLLLSNLIKQAEYLYLEIPLPATACKHETNPNHYSCLTDDGWLNLLRASGWLCGVSHRIDFTLPMGNDAYHLFVCKRTPTEEEILPQT